MAPPRGNRRSAADMWNVDNANSPFVIDEANNRAVLKSSRRQPENDIYPARANTTAAQLASTSQGASTSAGSSTATPARSPAKSSASSRTAVNTQRKTHTASNRLTAAGRRRESSEDEGETSSNSGIRSKQKRVRQKSPERPNPRSGQLLYKPAEHEILETSSLDVQGESEAFGNSKPIRMLSDYEIFDVRSMQLVDLGKLADGDLDPANQHWGIGGIVEPVLPNADEAAEFEDLDEQLHAQGGEQPRIMSHEVLGFTLDYTKENDPLYVETPHAWYLLKRPSKRYLEFYRYFYKHHKVLQLAVSTSLTEAHLSAKVFLELFDGSVDPMLHITWNQKRDAHHLLHLPDVLQTLDRGVTEKLQNSKLMTDLCKQVAIRERNKVNSGKAPKKTWRPLRYRTPWPKSLEQAVLDNLNPVCVTPFVKRLARPFYPRSAFNWIVAGEGKMANQSMIDGQYESKLITDADPRRYLQELLHQANKPPMRVSFDGQKVVELPGAIERNMYFVSVCLGETVYNIGDVVITRPGYKQDMSLPKIPRDERDHPTQVVGDFFWFGKILSIRRMDQSVHVQWFEHARGTLIEDIGHPQELFLTYACSDVSLGEVLAKAEVKKCHPDRRPDTVVCNQFFYVFMYDQSDGSFRSIPASVLDIWKRDPPENCPACIRQQEAQEATEDATIIEGGVFIGCKLFGVPYHLHDIVLFDTESGPCGIGKLTDIEELPSTRSHIVDPYIVTVEVLRRVTDEEFQGLFDIGCYSEHHLVMTRTTMQFRSQRIICKAFVLHKKTVDEMPGGVAGWCKFSPKHFYVTHVHMNPVNGSLLVESIRPVPRSKVAYCGECMKRERDEYEDEMVAYQHQLDSLPLRMYDPFAGVGGLALGMARAGPMKLTHAVEISPSAAETLRANAPETVVVRECSNIVLEHAINSAYSRVRSDIPVPPKDAVDILVAGFPCQPHSRLNMFQKADDLKSELILNILSQIDFYRPDYVISENVKGFVSHNLNSIQYGRHRVIGGIERGGIKLLVKGLIAMGYQIICGLLQAGHFGLPQTRNRFFLFAARYSCVLPDFPQPRYDFPKTDALVIEMPNGLRIQTSDEDSRIPIHPFVSVDGAIGDLKRWEWDLEQSQLVYKRPSHVPEIGAIDKVKVIHGDRLCGLLGPDIPYEYPPKSPFQARCREGHIEDLQHITQTFKEVVVERVMAIPMEPHADYRSLPPKLWEWQTSSPASAVAKRHYPGGMYGRLDAQSYFPTTVTNVRPTAKQSRVLHPSCKRILSVRELARSQGFPDSYRFVADDGDVKTMHRQIGNAVPMPLAEAIGREVLRAAYKTWKARQVHEQDVPMEEELGSREVPMIID